MMLYSLLFIIPIAWVSATEFADQPCAARSIPNKSVVCVCTADYCDTVIRETPVSGQAFTYSSSLSGERFNKTSAALTAYDDCVEATYDVKLALDRSKKYQTIQGFGAAVTDAAAINWMDLTDTNLRNYFVESYCGSSGLQYSMLRVPIGGTAFSTRAYAYSMTPENDTDLCDFELSAEDIDYKIPLIKACMEASDTSIKILASLWSPPAWMKSNNAYTGIGWLKEEYYQTLADYIYKFLEAYEAECIPTWGITTTNEPSNGIMYSDNPNSLGWTVDQMGNWLSNYLGPKMRDTSSAFTDVKILTNDDQRHALDPYHFKMMKSYPESFNYMDGLAMHWYSNKNVSAKIMQKAMEYIPDKFWMQTQASIIPSMMNENPVAPVDLGSWTRAEMYIRDILENLNYNSSGWLDWNLALNTEGGPSYLNRQVDSPMIVNATAGEIYKQPMYYAMGQVSKFIQPDSVRIDVTATTTVTCATCASCDNDVEHVAVETPDDSIVVVLYNRGEEEKTVLIHTDEHQVVTTLGAKTISTIEFAC